MKKSISGLLSVGSVCIFVTAVFITVFNSLPIEQTSLAIDWKGIHKGLEGGSIRYGTGIRNPPWSLIPLLPLGLLTFRSSWGVLVLATLMTEIASVPGEIRKGLRIPITILLAISYFSLRNIADGNLELMPIIGILILIYAYRAKNPWLLALGFLLASAKPQTTWLLVAVIAFYVVRTWNRNQILRTLGVIILVVTITMVLFGKNWFKSMILIEQRGSIMDVSLLTVLNRLAVPSILVWCFWGTILCVTLYIGYSTCYAFDRKKAGLLISAGLLLAPYAAGNNLLTLLAIGVIPLFIGDTKSAIALTILFNLPYLFITESSIRFWYGAYFATTILFLSWIVFAWKTKGSEQKILLHDPSSS